MASKSKNLCISVYLDDHADREYLFDLRAEYAFLAVRLGRIANERNRALTISISQNGVRSCKTMFLSALWQIPGTPYLIIAITDGITTNRNHLTFRAKRQNGSAFRIAFATPKLLPAPHPTLGGAQNHFFATCGAVLCLGNSLAGRSRWSCKGNISKGFLFTCNHGYYLAPPRFSGRKQYSPFATSGQKRHWPAGCAIAA